MANEANGKGDGLVTLIFKVPPIVDRAIQTLFEQEQARGMLPSKSDILRRLLLAGLKAEGVELEAVPQGLAEKGSPADK